MTALLDQIDEDIADVFLSDFTVSATWTHGNTTTTISGIFDKEFKAINMQDGQVETFDPQIILKDSDITGIAKGDTVVIDSATYYVIGIQPGGPGVIMIGLSKTRV